MNLLIVDDNRYVVESLKKQIFTMMPEIDEVYGCYSVAHAKEVFLSHPVALLISDIEMPGEDGFALLEWLRHENLKPITVLLTSFAEFGYAQRSLEYGVISYLLKPLDEGALHQALNQMIEKYKKQNQDQRRMNCGDQFLQQQRSACASYLRELLQAAQTGNEAAVRMFLSRRPAAFAQACRFQPISLEIRCRSTAWSQELVAYAAENALRELAQESQLEYVLLYHIEQDSYALLFLLRQDQLPETVRKLAEHLVAFFSRFFQEHLDMAVQYVLRDTCTLERLPEVLGVSGIEPRRASVQARNLPLSRPDTEVWRQMILSADLDSLHQSVEAYIRSSHNPAYGMVDFLGAFQVDWYLMVNSILKEYTKLTVTDIRKEGFSRWMTAGREQLLELVMEDASRVLELLDADQHNSLHVVRIRSYIQANIADVTRSSIAAHFHFSPNYLSKLFHNVEGISLIQYIQNQRMERARELLANTDHSISEIATEIGYPNFSHFSKRFRDLTGCTPNEYRRRARANEKKGKGT